VTALRRAMLLEIHVFALIPIFAAMMARGVGFGLFS
jgi:putative membrane protein